jgi:hypothetical protein
MSCAYSLGLLRATPARAVLWRTSTPSMSQLGLPRSANYSVFNQTHSITGVTAGCCLTPLDRQRAPSLVLAVRHRAVGTAVGQALSSLSPGNGRWGRRDLYVNGSDRC